VTIRGCLQWAYGIVDVSGPAWITEESYDIVAKASGPVPADDLHRMLQTLLDDRFQLKTHRETHLSPVRALVVGKNGIKNLRTVENGDPVEVRRIDGRLEVKNAPMSRIAGVLGSPFGNMPLEKVVDDTGLSGLYDITLNLKDFDPKDAAFASYDEMRSALVAFVSEALERQYGLKLERRAMPIDVLIVDSGNKVPTAN